MQKKCEIIERKSQPTLSVFTSTTAKELHNIIGPTFDKLAQYLEKFNMKAEGDLYGYSAYHNLNLLQPDMEHLEVEVGFMLSKPIPSCENLKLNDIPMGKYISLLHVGPISSIGETYKILNEWLIRNQKNTTGTIYEIYLNDKEKTLPEQLKTQIIYKIQ
jgi:effector-binding domain-containing protein